MCVEPKIAKRMQQKASRLPQSSKNSKLNFRPRRRSSLDGKKVFSRYLKTRPVEIPNEAPRDGFYLSLLARKISAQQTVPKSQHNEITLRTVAQTEQMVIKRNGLRSMSKFEDNGENRWLSSWLLHPQSSFSGGERGERKKEGEVPPQFSVSLQPPFWNPKRCLWR